MKLFAELLFVALVALDLVLTYKVIRSGKGREAAFARHYINNPVLFLIKDVVLQEV